MPTAKRYAASLRVPLVLVAVIAVSLGVPVTVGATPPAALEYHASVDPGALVATLNGPSARSSFGNSIAGSGSTVIVGAPQANSGTGAAYLYTKGTSGWPQRPSATLRGTERGGWFGLSVSISGGVAVVGAPGAYAHRGAVYLFEEGKGSWRRSPVATLIGKSKDDNFGGAVSINGTRLLVGASQLGVGAAFLYTETASGWRSPQVTEIPGQADSSFGDSVAMGDSYFAIGAPCADSCEGSVYVYALSAGGWALTKVVGDGANYAQFGCSIAVHGNDLIVGAQFYGANKGAAYLYVRQSTGWPARPSHSFYGEPKSEFGSAVSISGGKVWIGAPNDLHGTTDGLAFGYEYSHSSWTPVSQLEGSVAGDNFGDSIAILGGAVLVGAPSPQTDPGAVYVYGS